MRERIADSACLGLHDNDSTNYRRRPLGFMLEIEIA